MSIINNAVPERDFVRVPNAWLRDPDLSYRAKGILAYIASHAASYRLTIEQIIGDAREGRDAVRAGLKELEARGYLTRIPVRHKGRIREYNYQVSTGDWEAGDGFPVTSADLGKHDVSPGQTGDWKTTPGKPPTKKTNPSYEGEKTMEKTEPAKRASKIPSDWSPTSELAEWCRMKVLPEKRWSESARSFVLDQTERFRDHFAATGKAYKDWDAAWRNWMRRAFERDYRNHGGPPPRQQQFKSAAEKAAEAKERAMERAKRAQAYIDQGMPPKVAYERAGQDMAQEQVATCTTMPYIEGVIIDGGQQEVTSK